MKLTSSETAHVGQAVANNGKTSTYHLDDIHRRAVEAEERRQREERSKR